MAASLAEAWLALTGALLLARGDPRGLACFDPSVEGFWHSFRAMLLCYPLYLILLSFPVQLGPPEPIDEVRLFAAESIHFVVAWVAFPLVVLPLVDWLGRGSRFLGFITAYNWCQVPQTALFAVVALAGGTGLLSTDAILVCDLVVGLAGLVYGWYIARVALALGGGRAALVILADVALAAVLTHVSTAMF
jgi:hypothetical protein